MFNISLLLLFEVIVYFNQYCLMAVLPIQSFEA